MAHIPKGNTAQLELVTFRQALSAANTPSPDYDIEKWIYAPSFYSEYRYILGTRGKKPVGIPSHMDERVRVFISM